MTKIDCEKCGVKIDPFVENSNIQDSLCETCYKEWKIFHKLHLHEIEKKYPQGGKHGHHATWSVFIGELPNFWQNDEVKVEFT